MRKLISFLLSPVRFAWTYIQNTEHSNVPLQGLVIYPLQAVRCGDGKSYRLTDYRPSSPVVGVPRPMKQLEMFPR